MDQLIPAESAVKGTTSPQEGSGRVVLRWVIASLLIALCFGVLHFADIQFRCYGKMSHLATIIWGTALFVLFCIGPGLIAATTLNLDRKRLAVRILGSLVLSIPASIVSLLVLYGILQGRNTLLRAGWHMLAELPLRVLLVTVFIFVGVSIVRGILRATENGSAP